MLYYFLFVRLVGCHASFVCVSSQLDDIGKGERQGQLSKSLIHIAYLSLFIEAAGIGQ
jgi:hypothetical protein